MPTYFLKTQFLLFVLTSFILLNSGCKKNTTEPVETLALTVEDVSCTEVWVKITTANYQTPNTLTLFVNDKANQTITLVSNDTLLYVDSLLPNQSYKIKAAFTTNNQQLTTNEVVTKTMDTTNHNFTWQTFNFGGDAGSSGLSDVAIIDENNIWAFGVIYMNDSLGNPDPHAFNAVHWNGTNWELKRIMFYTICGQTSLTAYPAKSIYAFSGNDIWIAMDGDQVARINETSQISTQCLPWSFSINKMWGTSSNDLYVVGNNGNIAHYDGKNWKKIESGTTTDLSDIWGTADGKTIWVCGISTDNYHSVLLKYENGHSTTVWQRDGLAYVDPYGRSVGSVWLDNQMTYLTSSYGVYRIRGIEPTRMPENINAYSKVIRGNAGNDILTMSSGGKTWHYNGVNWELIIKEDPNYFLISCGLYGNTAAVVGSDFSVGLGAAMIAVGRR